MNVTEMQKIATQLVRQDCKDKISRPQRQNIEG